MVKKMSVLAAMLLSMGAANAMTSVAADGSFLAVSSYKGTFFVDEEVANGSSSNGVSWSAVLTSNYTYALTMLYNGTTVYSSSITNNTSDRSDDLTYTANLNNYKTVVSVGDYLSSTGKSAGTTFTYSVAAVPEPQTYAMLLAGLGMVGVMARRRQAK